MPRTLEQIRYALTDISETLACWPGETPDNPYIAKLLREQHTLLRAYSLVYPAKPFRFHRDSGHGWLEVSARQAAAIGLTADDFTPYGYRIGARFFLEEDVDAYTFAHAWERMNPNDELPVRNIDYPVDFPLLERMTNIRDPKGDEWKYFQRIER